LRIRAGVFQAASAGNGLGQRNALCLEVDLLILSGGAQRGKAEGLIRRLSPALSVMVTVPVLLPTAAGVKVTLMVQLPPAATLAPHALVSAKSPVAEMLVMFSGAAPVLLSVTVCVLLVLPSCCLANVRFGVERLTTGPIGTTVNDDPGVDE
jgi:hypothetical protein